MPLKRSGCVMCQREIPLHIQQVYTSPNSAKDSFSWLVSETQISSQTTSSPGASGFRPSDQEYHRDFPALAVPKELIGEHLFQTVDFDGHSADLILLNACHNMPGQRIRER